MTAVLGELTNVAAAYLSAGLGAGLVTFGAAYGIGRIAASAMEGIARQPEASAKIQTAMIISAALIEGIALLSAVICLLLNLK
ncbi:MAG: ATP synthase F0 subunit C [bacterium]